MVDALAVVLTIVGAVEAVAWAQISRVIVDSLLTGQYALFGRYLRYMFLMACVWATVSLASGQLYVALEDSYRQAARARDTRRTVSA